MNKHFEFHTRYTNYTSTWLIYLNGRRLSHFYTGSKLLQQYKRDVTPQSPEKLHCCKISRKEDKSYTQKRGHWSKGTLQTAILFELTQEYTGTHRVFKIQILSHSLTCNRIKHRYIYSIAYVLVHLTFILGKSLLLSNQRNMYSGFTFFPFSQTPGTEGSCFNSQGRVLLLQA